MAFFPIKDEDLTGLKDKVVIVTGGSSGIGLATVQLLLSLGAAVVSADIVAPAETPAGSGAFTFVETDVASWPALTALFRRAIDAHGRIDHVFASAGPGPRADYLSMAVDANGDPVEPTFALLDVALRGVINTVTLAIFHMRRQQPQPGGSVVVMGSTMGIQRCRAVDYTTAKHGAIGFARGLLPVLEAAGLPVRVNTLAPTWTESAVLPAMRQVMDHIGVELQPAAAVARAAALLMADARRNGDMIHVQCGRYQEIDKAVLLPAAEAIRGPDYPAEDDVLRRALEFLHAAAAAEQAK